MATTTTGDIGNIDMNESQRPDCKVGPLYPPATQFRSVVT
jgi:hypothetical protein